MFFGMIPSSFCLLEDLLAIDVPARVELAFVLVRPLLGHMVRRVHRARAKYMKNGLFGATCLASAIIALAFSTRSTVKW